MCVCQVLRKNNIFCSLREKEKIYLVTSLCFSTEFYHFYTRLLPPDFNHARRWAVIEMGLEIMHGKYS